MSKKYWLMPALLLCLTAVPAAADPARDGTDAPMEHHMMLPDDKRALLHAAMQKSMEKDKTSFEQMQSLHQKMHAILAADTFDQKAFMTTAQQMQKLQDHLMQDRLAAFASVAGQLTPEERETVAKHFAMRHEMHHHAMHGEWHHPMDGMNPAELRNTPAAHDAYPYPPYGARE